MLLLVVACGAPPEPAASEPFAAEPAARPATPEAPTVIFLGDSLTAGLGVPESGAFPAIVGRQLAEAGLPVKVVNAGVSGDTTTGGLERLDWMLAQEPEVLVVGLGANDGLRGASPARIEANLDRIVERARSRGTKVLLLGMRLPPSYGEYAERFAAVYPRVAARHEVPLVPFLLRGVGGRAALNQADGIHPTAAGHAILADNVRPALERLLRER
jgi:acyl-CoA thioesterase-1